MLAVKGLAQHWENYTACYGMPSTNARWEAIAPCISSILPMLAVTGSTADHSPNVATGVASAPRSHRGDGTQQLASTVTLAPTDGAHCAEEGFGIPPTPIVLDTVIEIAMATLQVIGGGSPKFADGATARTHGASAAEWHPNQLESTVPTASLAGSIGPLVHLQPASTNATVPIRGLQHNGNSFRISHVGLPCRNAEHEVGEHLAAVQPPPHGTHWQELRAVTRRTNQPGSTTPTATFAGGIGAVVNLQLASNVAASLPRNTRRAMSSAAVTRVQLILHGILNVDGVHMVARHANQPVAAIPTASRGGRPRNRGTTSAGVRGHH